ncbi:Copper insertion chaperone and transporter component [Modestobacter italicus]|uniref:Copper insertion chaperone and transporter component n=1 Tax=Modestobacter italicus (strain DSM 44449 / CECT 9708 / BC 501) TaxID=2732864 RepID=I4ETZ7_MODI5|nr:heavy-metal-associated domain-containing protein [Modestobacter marinus]CCH86860.1 Copper insertion chaperone and transporter component [Modestobacter marinus]
MSTLDFTVSGMTCQHCVASVTEEVTELPGVSEVDVDLATGRLHVVGEVTAEQVQAAVAEAGSYTAQPA